MIYEQTLVPELWKNNTDDKFKNIFLEYFDIIR